MTPLQIAFLPPPRPAPPPAPERDLWAEQLAANIRSGAQPSFSALAGMWCPQ